MNGRLQRRSGLPARGIFLPVTNGTVEVLYQVALSDAQTMDSLTITATLDSAGAALAFPAQAVFGGWLAPADDTGTASPTAPEPRFWP